MDEVSDALSERLGWVGAGRLLCRKWEIFSSVGVDRWGVWVVEVFMVEIEVVLRAMLRVVFGTLEDVGLLVGEGLDKRFKVSDWVGLVNQRRIEEGKRGFAH